MVGRVFLSDLCGHFPCLRHTKPSRADRDQHGSKGVVMYEVKVK